MVKLDLNTIIYFYFYFFENLFGPMLYPITLCYQFFLKNIKEYIGEITLLPVCSTCLQLPKILTLFSLQV